jgi:hypothetical protein
MINVRKAQIVFCGPNSETIFAESIEALLLYILRDEWVTTEVHKESEG